MYQQFGYVAVLLALLVSGSEDFYKVLNVSKDATTRDLRKAFKKAALEFHPDKNKDDPEAHDKFLLMNRAYETLKDPELRKQYDLFGEEGSGNSRSGRQQYHSWSYYHDNFGIYDDDPEIVTLDSAEFERAVLQSEDTWFINFYSPGCSHCHELAPNWRRMARELEHVVRVGAVNCAEERHLCRQQQIHAYPSLLLYPEKEEYEGDRTVEQLVGHVLRQLQVMLIDVDASNLKHLSKHSPVLSRQPWLLFFSGSQHPAASDHTRLKVAAMMEGVLNVGQVDCAETDLCTTLNPQQPAVFYPEGQVSADSGTPISSGDAQEIAAEALNLLPPPPTLSEAEYRSMREALRSETTASDALPWLVQLADDLTPSLQLARLPTLLESTSFGRLDCGALPALCRALHAPRLPAFVLFRPASRGGGHELFHGRAASHEVAAFAREAAAGRLSALGPDDFPAALRDGRARVVDFFAPWCPPCMRLLPELRRASARSDLPFGSVDCTTHARLCSKYNIRSYPTVIVYNQSEPHLYRGPQTADGLLTFIEDTVRPAVLTLGDATQQERARRRPADQLWIIDFYASWCGPCVQFAPEYRRAARLLRQYGVDAVVAMVDCADHRPFCAEQNVRSYPTVRIYRPGEGGLHRYSVYSGARDAESLLSWALSSLPDPVEELAEDEFIARVLDGPGPWLVDYYTPWCGYCQRFAPKFQLLARSLAEASVRCGRVDCQRYPRLCRDAGVRAYPTLKLYEGGGRLDMVGVEVPSLQPERVAEFVRAQLGAERGGTQRRERDEL